MTIQPEKTVMPFDMEAFDASLIRAILGARRDVGLPGLRQFFIDVKEGYRTRLAKKSAQPTQPPSPPLAG